MSTLGWRFTVQYPSGDTHSIKIAEGASLSFDLSAECPRSLTSAVVYPDQAQWFDPSQDSLLLELRIGPSPTEITDYPMGQFYAREDSVQCDVLLLDDGSAGDLTHYAFDDGFIKLSRADKRPYQLPAYSDPSTVMGQFLQDAGLDHAVEGSISGMGDGRTWDAFTPWRTIISDLANVCGHRPPWCDAYGVARSIAAPVGTGEQIVDLTDLNPFPGTIVISSARLSAPNQVVVWDDTAPEALVGQWDAPGSSPNNATVRGWTESIGQSQQGLASAVQAQLIAEARGKQGLARQLNFTCPPTPLLDGPVPIRFRSADWLVQSWSCTLSGASDMSVTAIEVV